MMRTMALVMVMLASACVEQPMTYRELERLAHQQQGEAISRPAPDTCHMAAHQSLIGMEGDAIDRASLPPLSRVVCHNCPVTMDYRAERLNVLLGADGKVASLSCG